MAWVPHCSLPNLITPSLLTIEWEAAVWLCVRRCGHWLHWPPLCTFIKDRLRHTRHEGRWEATIGRLSLHVDLPLSFFSLFLSFLSLVHRLFLHPAYLSLSFPFSSFLFTYTLSSSSPHSLFATLLPSSVSIRLHPVFGFLYT